MSDPATFNQQFLAAVKGFVASIELLAQLQDRMLADSALITGAAAASQAGARKDLVLADYTSVQAAITQMLFTYNSGSPAQKAAFYKML